MRFQSGLEFGMRGIKSGESFPITEFGGSGDDNLDAAVVLTNGDIVMSGRTASSVFLGQSTAAYTDTAGYCLWLGIFDPKTFENKSVAFIAGRQKLDPLYGFVNVFPYASLSDISNKGHSLATDGTDVYIIYGGSSGTGYKHTKIEKRSGTNLSALYTKNFAASTVNSVQLLGSVCCYNGEPYMAYVSNGDFAVKVTKFDATLTTATSYDLYTLDPTSCGNNASAPCILPSANGFYIWTSMAKGRYYSYVSKWSHTFTFDTRANFSAKATTSNTEGQSFLLYDNKVYCAFKSNATDGYNNTLDTRIVALNQSDLSAVSGFADCKIVGTSTGDVPSLFAYANGVIGCAMKRIKTEVSDFRKAALLSFDKDTGGATISMTEGLPLYKDGSNVNVTSKNIFITTAIPMGTKSVLLLGKADFALTGKTFEGVYDCIGLAMDRNAKLYV